MTVCAANEDEARMVVMTMLNIFIVFPFVITTHITKEHAGFVSVVLNRAVFQTRLTAGPAASIGGG